MVCSHTRLCYLMQVRLQDHRWLGHHGTAALGVSWSICTRYLVYVTMPYHEDDLRHADASCQIPMAAMRVTRRL